MTNDLIARLRQPIIATAYERGHIMNMELGDRLIRERGDAADALEAQARRIAELEEVHEANLKAIQINADVFSDGMKKIMALCDAKDARIAELEAALKPIIPDTALDEEEYSMVWNYHLVKARAALEKKNEIHSV